LKIATWNLNSIRAREARLLDWLSRVAPDVVCLQETKVTEQQFPFEAIKERGYHAAVYGQKTYNGVALLARDPVEDVTVGFGDDADDPQARCISGLIHGIRFISVYVPNGESVGSAKYVYKQEWLSRLFKYLDRIRKPETPLMISGDFNIAPHEDDVANVEEWQGTVLFNPQMTAVMQELLSWGLQDVFRIHQKDPGLYSWWDYRQLAFPKNQGLRIDHILATPELASRTTAAMVDRNERKGSKPSDHAPVIAELKWP
jgi:exodeoxyribonuclease III